jgi:uncharacterized protein (DUF58 family)
VDGVNDPQQSRELAGVVIPRPSSFRVTRQGWYWLLLAAVMLGVGVYKGVNLLLLLACLMLMLWCVNAWLAGRPPRRLRARRWFAGPVFARTPTDVDVEVTNPGRSAVAAVGIENHGPGQELSWFVPRLRGGETLRFRREVVLPRRGPYHWGPLRAVCGYPLGLVRRQRGLTADETLVVLPRLGWVHRARLRRFLPPVGLVQEWSRQSLRRDPAAQSEFHGLRVFRSGDSPRWIHWRTSARQGELMVREFEDAPSEDLIVVLDLSAQLGARNSECGTEDSSEFRVPRSELEEAISLAATVCWEWCRQQGQRLVLAVCGSRPAVLDGASGREHALRLLECLALVQPTPTPDRDRALLLERLAGRPLPRAPVLLIGPAAAGWVGQLEQALRRPVAPVDVAGLDALDFYERPPDHAP